MKLKLRPLVAAAMTVAALASAATWAMSPNNEPISPLVAHKVTNPAMVELGKKLWLNVSKEAWQQWIKLQTMIINENRLNLADARARQYLARQMEKHFFGEGADVAAGYVPPTQA